MESCEKCYFYKGKLCYRFPMPVEKDKDDFCGEFKHKMIYEDYDKRFYDENIIKK